MSSLPKPLPTPEGLNGEWYGWCAKRELRFQRCRACGRWRHPPRYRCAGCHSPAWSWEQSTGQGIVFSWTVTHQAPHPAWASEVPYAVLIVQLDEEVRVVSGLRGCSPGELLLGMAVTVDFEERSERLTVPVFRPR